jgi:energy-coupling factor transporter ATP-binding protein EcfA2
MIIVNNELDAQAIEREKLKEKRAISALLEPNPMDRFVTAYSISHVGHTQILRAIIYSECLKSSCTTKGLQPAVTGQRGSGKSHAVRTATHLIPKEAVYTATISPKALFYKNPEQKTTFYMDDAVIPEELTSLMKRKQTQFQEPTIYGTVVDKKWMEVSIDKRMVFITTSVAQLGDEQLTDRALLIDIKNEKTDDELFYQFESERRTKGLPEFPECEEVELCRDMLMHIRNNEYRVILPALDFAYYHDRRLMEQCYDLMEASAILNYLKREHQEDDRKVIIVKAIAEDLANALNFDMFRFSESKAFAKMTKSERAFDQTIQEDIGKAENKHYTEKEIADLTKLTVPAVRNYLYGRGNSPTTLKDQVGLCGKTSWYKIDIEKEIATESVKNHIIVQKHTYQNAVFAWIRDVE